MLSVRLQRLLVAVGIVVDVWSDVYTVSNDLMVL